MTEPIRLAPPPAGTHLVRFFGERVESLKPAMDLGVMEHDELAQVSGLEITSVFTTAAAVEVGYAVLWEAFHACNDQRVSGRSLRTVRGRLEGGDWLFEPHSPSALRDTVDEF